MNFGNRNCTRNIDNLDLREHLTGQSSLDQNDFVRTNLVQTIDEGGDSYIIHPLNIDCPEQLRTHGDYGRAMANSMKKMRKTAQNRPAQRTIGYSNSRSPVQTHHQSLISAAAKTRDARFDLQSQKSSIYHRSCSNNSKAKSKYGKRKKSGPLIYYQDKYDAKKERTYEQLYKENKRYENKKMLRGLLSFVPEDAQNMWGSIYSRSKSRSRSRSKSVRSTYSKNSKSGVKNKKSIMKSSAMEKEYIDLFVKNSIEYKCRPKAKKAIPNLSVMEKKAFENMKVRQREPEFEEL